MADALKTLFQGQLGNAAATLATVPGGTSWLIKNITLINTDTSDRTCALYLNGTTAPFLITPTAMTILAGAMASFGGDSLTLAAAGTLGGIASVASKITITVSGDEVS